MDETILGLPKDLFESYAALAFGQVMYAIAAFGLFELFSRTARWFMKLVGAVTLVGGLFYGFLGTSYAWSYEVSYAEGAVILCATTAIILSKRLSRHRK